jgi:hypothetical protein
MVFVRNLLAVAAAVAMVGTPVIASAAPASAAARLSVVQASKARVGTKTADASKLTGVSTIVYVLVALAAVGGIILIADKGSKSP